MTVAIRPPDTCPGPPGRGSADRGAGSRPLSASHHRMILFYPARHEGFVRVLAHPSEDIARDGGRKTDNAHMAETDGRRHRVGGHPDGRRLLMAGTANADEIRMPDIGKTITSLTASAATTYPRELVNGDFEYPSMKSCNTTSPASTATAASGSATDRETTSPNGPTSPADWTRPDSAGPAPRHRAPCPNSARTPSNSRSHRRNHPDGRTVRKPERHRDLPGHRHHAPARSTGSSSTTRAATASTLTRCRSW